MSATRRPVEKSLPRIVVMWMKAKKSPARTIAARGPAVRAHAVVVNPRKNSSSQKRCHDDGGEQVQRDPERVPGQRQGRVRGHAQERDQKRCQETRGKDGRDRDRDAPPDIADERAFAGPGSSEAQVPPLEGTRPDDEEPDESDRDDARGQRREQHGRLVADRDPDGVQRHRQEGKDEQAGEERGDEHQPRRRSGISGDAIGGALEALCPGGRDQAEHERAKAAEEQPRPGATALGREDHEQQGEAHGGQQPARCVETWSGASVEIEDAAAARPGDGACLARRIGRVGGALVGRVQGRGVGLGAVAPAADWTGRRARTRTAAGAGGVGASASSRR